MSEFITPEHKIIALILEASGEPTDADKVFCLGNIPDVALAVRQLREWSFNTLQAKPYRRRTLKQFQNVLPSPFLTISSHLKTLVKAKLIRPEIEPVHAATALQGNDKQEAHSEMVDDKVSEGVQGHTEEVPDEAGSYRLRLPSRCKQKTWIKPVRLFLTSFHLTPHSVL